MYIKKSGAFLGTIIKVSTFRCVYENNVDFATISKVILCS